MTTAAAFSSPCSSFLTTRNFLSKSYIGGSNLKSVRFFFSKIVVYPHLLLGFREYWTVVNPGLQYPSFILMFFVFFNINIYTNNRYPIGHHICPVLCAFCKYSSVVNPRLQYPSFIYINFFDVNMPEPCTFAWLYLFNPGCPCLGTLDVLMSPDIGRNNLFLLITDRVHTVGFKQR